MLPDRIAMVKDLFLCLMGIAVIGQTYCAFGLGDKWARFLFVVILEGLIFIAYFGVLGKLLQ